jgi:hypothetical protein
MGVYLVDCTQMQEEDSHIRPILEAVKRDVQPGSEEMEHESPAT